MSYLSHKTTFRILLITDKILSFTSTLDPDIQLIAVNEISNSLVQGVPRNRNVRKISRRLRLGFDGLWRFIWSGLWLWLWLRLRFWRGFSRRRRCRRSWRRFSLLLLFNFEFELNDAWRIQTKTKECYTSNVQKSLDNLLV